MRKEGIMSHLNLCDQLIYLNLQPISCRRIWCFASTFSCLSLLRMSQKNGNDKIPRWIKSLQRKLEINSILSFDSVKILQILHIVEVKYDLKHSGIYKLIAGFARLTNIKQVTLDILSVDSPLTIYSRIINQ